MAGLEPARAFYGPTDFKSVASAISPHRLSLYTGKNWVFRQHSLTERDSGDPPFTLEAVNVLDSVLTRTAAHHNKTATLHTLPGRHRINA